MLSVVAGERVRVAYQLCQAIQADLKTSDIKFQTGQLIQLSLAAKALIEQLGIRDEIVELGAVPYELLHQVYRACDLYVTAAYAETFAHPLVEAMASGLPIAASDLPVHREVCRDVALYFRTFDHEGLAQCVETLAEAKKGASMPLQSGKQQSTEFSWPAHLQKMIDQAKQLIVHTP